MRAALVAHHALFYRLREGEPFDGFDSLRSLTTGRYARSWPALLASHSARSARSWQADLQVRLGWTLALPKTAFEVIHLNGKSKKLTA